MNILAVATALDTSGRKRELLAAALLARGDAAGSITYLNTGVADGEDAALAAGAAEAYQLQDPLVDAVSCDALLDVVVQACTQFSPAVLLLTGDDCGLELSARLAVRLNAACISACSGFEQAPDGALHYLRAVFGGRALETLASTTPLTLVCIKPKAFALPAPSASQCASQCAPQRAVQTLDIKPAKVAVEVTRIEAVTTQHAGAVHLEDAAIIVSGGRGVNGVNGFAQLDELAQLLGGALGASRAAVDLGWISSAHQVGQTGKTVAPEIYFAIGISGAMQHLAGISAAKRVVAINTDDQAPIFGVADVGVVGDANVLVSALLGELK